MKLEVCGHRVLIKPEFPKEETETGIVVGVGKTFEREKMATTVGRVISIGDMAWKAFDGDKPEWRPWAKVGDKVYFTKFTGRHIVDEETDDEYFIVNDEDVQAVILEDEGNTNE